MPRNAPGRYYQIFPGSAPELDPEVPTRPWSIVPGLVPGYFRSLIFGTGPFLFSTREWLPIVPGHSVLPAHHPEVSGLRVLLGVVGGLIRVGR